MDWKSLFLSYKGRLTRTYWWIGILILGVAEAVLLFLALRAAGFPLAALLDPTPKTLIIEMLVMVVLLRPNLSLLIKRLHDRSRTGWWAFVLYGIIFLLSVMDAYGLDGTEGEPNLLFFLVAAPSMLVIVWLLIELGFLRGVRGTNKYGPDPLEDASPR